jgi:hypothetical protein
LQGKWGGQLMLPGMTTIQESRSISPGRRPARLILGKAKGFTRLTDMKRRQLTLCFPFQEDTTLVQTRLRLATINLAINHLSLVVETRATWYRPRMTPTLCE